MAKRAVSYFFLFLVAVIIVLLLYLNRELLQWFSTSFGDSVSGLKEKHIIEDLRIRSNLELLIQGRLGLFFHFHFFGCVTWMLIPLGVYFLATIKRRVRWQVALFILFVCYVLATALYGYWHYRYIFTLYPMAVCLVFLLLNDVIARHPRLRIPVICVLIACIALPLYYNYTPLIGKHIASRGGVAIGMHGDRPGTSVNHDRFPHGILRRINAVKCKGSGDVILEIGAPFLHYHTDAELISYKLKSVRRALWRNRKDVFRMAECLKNKFSIRYVVLPDSMERVFHGSGAGQRAFVSMLEKECTLVVSEKGYKLYRLIDDDER